MKYAKLGRTGCEVSRLCLGTMNFGALTSEEDSFRIMDEALDMGINFFDTANGYAGGLTESIIGRWLAQGDGRRERVVLATKVWTRMGDGPNRNPGLSAYKIKRELEESLQRLQTDHIDLYQMHYIDRSATWEEKWGAMEDLVRAGKVFYVGSSNHAGWDIARAQGFARARGFLGLVCEQHHYNLLWRDAEREVFPACKCEGLGVITYSPIGGGLLGGNVSDPEKGARSDSEYIRGLLEKYRGQIEEYEAFCEELGESPAVVAVAWQLANPVITSPIVGPRKLDHLTSMSRAVELELDAQALERLESIFPGPGQYMIDRN